MVASADQQMSNLVSDHQCTWVCALTSLGGFGAVSSRGLTITVVLAGYRLVAIECSRSLIDLRQRA
jgi:hypothetical protein